MKSGKNNSISRFREKYTTIIGALTMLAAISMYVASKFTDFEVSYIELGAVGVLGWVFLTARDTLLEGIFLGLFKKR